jgi:hypothetical protein
MSELSIRREGDRYEICRDGETVVSGSVGEEQRITDAEFRAVRHKLATTITGMWDKAVAGQPMHPAEQEALSGVLNCMSLPWNLSG